MPVKELFGGSMEADIPESFLDASELRQIPDHQEVFVDKKEGDISVIIEILEYQQSTESDLDAMKLHITDIASTNNNMTYTAAAESGTNTLLFLDLESSPTIPPATYLKQWPNIFSLSVEPAKKWGRDQENGGAPEPILVLLAYLIRIKDHKTDILITLNLPFQSRQDLESLRDYVQNFQLHGPAAPPTTASQRAESKILDAKKILKSIIDTLKIEDYSLFGK